MMDVITLKGLEFFGHHGAYEQERTRGQTFRLDVKIEADLQEACVSDNIEDTVDYSHVVDIARKLVEGPPYLLLESLAGSLSDHLLKLPRVNAVSVKIMKPNVDLNNGKIDYASVSIHRSNKV